MTHEKRIEIRWRDLDSYGHVNQAVYLTYAEEVLDDWFRTKLGREPGVGLGLRRPPDDDRLPRRAAARRPRRRRFGRAGAARDDQPDGQGDA